MENAALDQAVIAAVFEQAAYRGWADVNIAEAARDAGLPLDRVRARFPGRGAVLLRFGVMADGIALRAPSDEPSARERLFDMLMLRFDALQQHRDGVQALLRHLPTDPATSLLLYTATLRSMKWLLDGAGIPSNGVVGALRVHGLLALWTYALRAWDKDDSPDLSATMAAVDRGLDRALQFEGILPGRGPSSAAEAAGVFTDAGAVDAMPPVADTTTDAPSDVSPPEDSPPEDSPLDDGLPDDGLSGDGTPKTGPAGA